MCERSGGPTAPLPSGSTCIIALRTAETMAKALGRGGVVCVVFGVGRLVVVVVGCSCSVLCRVVIVIMSHVVEMDWGWGWGLAGWSLTLHAA